MNGLSVRSRPIPSPFYLVRKSCFFARLGCFAGFAIFACAGCLRALAGPDDPRSSADQSPHAPMVASVSLPEGFTIPRSTLSPDGRLGVLVPDVDHYQEHNGNRLVDAATGKELALIRAATGMVHMNHGGIYPQWTDDGKGLLWMVGGKWSPRAMVYLRIADGKAAWQRELLSTSQQEILKRVRKTDPVAYAAVVKEKQGHGEAFPDGFTIDVNVVGSELGLPLHFIVSLTSDSGHDNCPPGGEIRSGRLYDPLPSERKPFSVMPLGEVVEARMRGVLAADGTITWSGFKAATGAKAVKRHQYLYGNEWQGDLPEDLATKFRAAVPEAVAAVQAYKREHPEEWCWSIMLDTEQRAPDSLAVDFLMLIDSNSQGLADFPQEGEIVGCQGGSLEEDGTVKWKKLDLATGAEAVRRRAAMKQDDSIETPARAEIRRRVEAAAPETMAALLAFAATQPKQDEVCGVDFVPTRPPDQHPGVRPYPFALTMEPAYVASREVRMPLEAEFQARLEGALQADGTIVWGGFTLLHGEEARKARRVRDDARNHAGWPSF